MFYYEISWFYEDFKSENLVFLICTQFRQQEYWACQDVLASSQF